MGAVVIFGHLDEVLDRLHLVHLYSKWPPETCNLFVFFPSDVYSVSAEVINH